MAEEVDQSEKGETEVAESGTESRFPELEELQREIDRRIRDNKRFLEKFLDDDFVDGEHEEGDEDGEEFEEL